jgi:hypothetical protein
MEVNRSLFDADDPAQAAEQDDRLFPPQFNSEDTPSDGVDDLVAAKFCAGDRHFEGLTSRVVLRHCRNPATDPSTSKAYISPKAVAFFSLALRTTKVPTIHLCSNLHPSGHDCKEEP